MKWKSIANTLEIVISLLLRGEKKIVIEDGTVTRPKPSREANGTTYSKIIIDDPVECSPGTKKRDRLKVMKQAIEQGKIAFPVMDHTELIETLSSWDRGELPVVKVAKKLPGNGIGVIYFKWQLVKVKTIE